MSIEASANSNGSVNSERDYTNNGCEGDNQLQEPSRELLHQIAQQMMQNANSTHQTTDQKPDTVEIPMDQDENEHSTTETTNLEVNTSQPTVMNLATVAEMFHQINTKMANLTTSVNDLKERERLATSDEVIAKCADEIKERVKTDLERENTKLRSDVSHLKFRNQALTSVVDRLFVEMSDIKQKLENVEMNNARKTVSISGLHVSDRKEEMAKEIQDFLEINIGVITTVEDCYKIGNNSPRLLIVSFQTIQEKRDTLRFKSYLKTSSSGNRVYINDYIPITTQEKRQRERQIITENENKEHPLDIKYTKYGLTIQGESYRQKVQPPTPKELVDIFPEKITQLMAMKIDTMDPIVKDKSVFQAYTAGVKSFAQIRDFYKKLKLIHPEARHIVCVYYLAGDQENHYTRDFFDDGEAGAGKAILDFMISNKLENRVFFITRKYGGIKMGAERFQCYLNTVKNLTEKALGIQQKEEMVNAEQELHKSASSIPPHSAKRPAVSPADEGTRQGYRAKKRPFRGRGTSYGRYNHSNRGRGLGSYRNPPPKRSFYGHDSYRNSQQDTGHSYRDDNSWEYGENDWQSPQDTDYYRRRRNRDLD